MTALYGQPCTIRPATAPEAGLVSYLRLASLVCLEMSGYSLAAIRAVMSRLPDVDGKLVATGRYYVAERSGDLLGGAGWAELPLRFRAEGLSAEDGGTVAFSGKGSVLLRGFFLDPDLGRRGAAKRLLTRIEMEVLRAGHAALETFAPATAESFYRGLGFKRVRGLRLDLGRDDPLPLLHLRRDLVPRVALAA